MAYRFPQGSTEAKSPYLEGRQAASDSSTSSQTKSKYNNIGFLLIPIFIILLIFLKINVFDNLSGGKNNHKKLKKYYKKIKTDINYFYE